MYVHSRRRRVTAQLLSVMLAALLLTADVPEARGESPSERPSEAEGPSAEVCNSRDDIRASDLPRSTPPSSCDLQGRVIDDHGARLVVPPPNRGMIAIVTYVDGGYQELQARTDDDGTVHLDSVGDERTRSPDRQAGSESGTGIQSSTAIECQQGARRKLNHRPQGTVRWYFRGSTYPPGTGIQETATDLVRGMNNVTSMRNICGHAENISISHSYLGGTDRVTGIDHTGTCPAGDGYSVVDFGNLPSSIVARFCAETFGTTTMTNFDVKFRKDYGWFTGWVPGGCSGRSSIEDVMTHEAGHVFALGDLNSGNTPSYDGDQLTMWQGARRCDKRRTTLGYGDILGLREMYGP